VDRAKGRIVSVDGTGNGDSPEAQLMRRMVDAFAEYERALIKARVRAALGVKRGRGERVGQVPYGMRLAPDGVHLEAEPAEQAVIGRVRELRAQGLTVRAIVEALNGAGTPARGKAWHPTSVRRLLARAA
jgi:DNA invertase Pin-like site-specific DNA recombinase